VASRPQPLVPDPARISGSRPVGQAHHGCHVPHCCIVEGLGGTEAKDGAGSRKGASGLHFGLLIFVGL